MKTMTKRVIAIAGVLALGLSAAKAQSDGALLDALVKKGVLSDQEAEDVRASEAKDFSTTAAGKLALPDYVSKLTIYGDARLRYEYLDEKPENTAALANGNFGANAATTDRARYRLRIGADYTFTDNFKAGFELESAQAGDSANQTFGAEYGKSPINIGLVYLQWKPLDFLTLTGGKQKNPLYTTDLMWDPDINPEGASEVATWSFPVDFGSSAAPSSDPKAVAAPAEPSDMSITVGLTAAQFDYAENSNAVQPPAAAQDVWQFIEQVPVQFNFNKTTFIKVVPGFDSYMDGGINTPNNVSTGASTAVGNGSSVTFGGPFATDHLQIFTAPGEFDWKMWDLPFKTYWDFAYNVEGKDRIQDVYLGNNGSFIGPVSAATTTVQQQNTALGDNIAWLVGLQVGQNKKKGDWSIKGDFRQVGLGSVDPNTNDSDWGDSFLNQQGIRVQSVYNFTDFLTGSLTVFDTWNLKSGLMDGSAGQNPAVVPLGGAGGSTVAGGTNGTSTTGTGSLVGVSSTQRVQVDLMWKF